jgi:hypothetical protein
MGFLDGFFGSSKQTDTSTQTSGNIASSASGNTGTSASTSAGGSSGTNASTNSTTRKPQQGTLAATQIHLKIGEIRDNLLVLKNGETRAILKATSINFNLKSEEEQNSIIYGYQSFLNSLEFPVQIVVRSRKLDIDDYIDKIRAIGEKQQNKLLQNQTLEYADFVKKLVEYTDIMQKEFYVIVAYEPIRARGVSFIQKFLQRLQPKDTYADVKKRHKEFEQTKKQIVQRLNIVQSGLTNCGINTEQLTTAEIIELFYNIYNPQISRTEKVRNLENFNVITDEDTAEEEKNLQPQ